MAEAFFAALHETGSTAGFRARMTDLGGVNQRIGLAELMAEGRRWDPETPTGVET
jgi:hypothetical protein